MKRLIFTLFIISSTLLLSSCSIFCDFVVINNSNNFLDIQYERKSNELGKGLQYLYLDDLKKGKNEWKELPQDRFEFDQKNSTIKVRLAPNEVFRVEGMDVFYVNKQPDEHFGLKSLSLVGRSGSIKYEGNQVFENFKPEGWDWFTRNATIYTITYK